MSTPIIATGDTITTMYAAAINGARSKIPQSTEVPLQVRYGRLRLEKLEIRVTALQTTYMGRFWFDEVTDEGLAPEPAKLPELEPLVAKSIDPKAQYLVTLMDQFDAWGIVNDYYMKNFRNPAPGRLLKAAIEDLVKP